VGFRRARVMTVFGTPVKCYNTIQMIESSPSKRRIVQKFSQPGLFDNVLTAVPAERGVEKEFVGPPYVPYDSAKIDIERKQPTVYSVMSRIRNRELDLCPAFQRSANLWKKGQQSRLIESLILNIPLPAFYMTEDQEGGNYRYRWHVVDGLQRLCAMRNFMLGDESGHYLKLRGLEYLTNYEGCEFKELPPSYQRNIEEAELQVYLIKPNTPDDLKFNIFRRVNTGGLPLNQQEIRHAMHQLRAASYLQELAQSDHFRMATGGEIKSARMTDREFVNRFLAFYLRDNLPEYKEMDSHLNAALKYIDTCPGGELEEIRDSFYRALDLLTTALGPFAFRRMTSKGPKKALNKALFEVFTVVAAQCPQQAACLAKNPKLARERYEKLFDDQSENGLNSVVQTSTGHVANIQRRYDIVRGYYEGL